MNPADVGRKVKETWPYDVANDGRRYIDIPDAEIGTMYLLANGEKGLMALGITATDPEKQLKQQEAQAELEKIEAKGGGLTSKQAGAKEVIDQLFDLYYGKPGEESLSLVDPGEWRQGAQLKALETKFKAGEANSVEERIYKYNRILESKRAQLAKAAGDAGNLAIQEQIMAGKGLPGPDSTPNEASGLFASAYDVFAGGKRPPRLDEELMLQEKGQQTNGTLPNIPQKDQGLQGPAGFLANIVGKASDFLVPQTKKALSAPFDPNHPLWSSPKPPAPQTLENIPQNLPFALQQTGKSMAELAKTTGSAGLELGLLRGAPGLIKKGLALKPGNVISQLGPVKTFGRIARRGTENVRIATKPMLDAARDYASDVPVNSPLAKSILKTLQKKAEITLPEVEKKLGRWGALAYTKAEEPRAKAEAQLINAVYGAARQQIKEKAPLVSTARTLSDIQRKALRGLGKVFNPLTIGAGITGFAGYKLGERLFGGDR